jgi:hypothetical protein
MTEVGTERAREAAEVLRAHGHDVVTCGDGERRALSCSVLRGQPCPLDSGKVDVAVQVERPEPLGLDDQGIICSIRRHVPVVVAAGPRAAGSSSLRPWAATVCSMDDLPMAASAAAVASLPLHSTVAAEAANQVAARLGGRMCWGADARRAGRGRIRLELISEEPVSATMRLNACVRAIGAVRAVDQVAPALDVVVAAPSE